MINATILPCPFGRKYQHRFRAGSTLADIVRDAPDLAVRDPKHLLVQINGEPRYGVPPEHFTARPKPGLNTVVTIAPRTAFGGDSAARGRTGVKLGAAGIGLAAGPGGAIFAGIAEVIGGAVLEVFAKPEGRAPRPVADKAEAPANTAGISLNPLKIGETLPAAFGTIKVAPPLIQGWTEIVGQDVVANALLGLEGEVGWADERVNETLISDLTGGTVTTRDGADGDTNIQVGGSDLKTYVEEFLNVQLPDWVTEAPGSPNLSDQGDPSTSRPSKVHAFAKDDADEIWLTFFMPQGMRKSPSQTEVATGFQIELRKRGETTWRVLPYIHFSFVDLPKPYYWQVRLIFSAAPGGLTTGFGEPWEQIAAEIDVAGSTSDDAANSDHVSDDYFDVEVTGNAWKGTTNAVIDEQNARLDIYLDPADADDPWPKGEYEIRMVKGAGSSKFAVTTFNNYHQVRQAGVNPKLVPSTNGTDPWVNSVDTTIWRSVVTVINEYPIAATNVAQLYVRVPNVTINAITALVSRKLPVWTGQQWPQSNTATRNAAAAIRHIWTDPQSADPFPTGYLNDQELGEFYDHCAANGLTYDAFVEDGDQVSLPVAIAKLAKAKVKHGPRRGVWWDKDRSNEAPVEALTAHNSSGLRVISPRKRAPHGYRARFRNSADEYRVDYRTVYRSGFSAANARDVRQFDATGLDTAAKVDAVVGYLLEEFAERAILIEATLPIHGRLLERLDLIAVTADALESNRHSARIDEILLDGDDVVGLALSNAMPFSAIADDIFALADKFAPGDIYAPAGAAGMQIVMGAGEAMITKQVTATEDTATPMFTTPFALTAGLEAGAIVMAGPFGQVTRRMYVLEKSGGTDQTVNIVGIPEANALVAA